MKKNLVNKIVLVSIGVVIILSITLLIQMMYNRPLELIEPTAFDSSKINIYETLDSDNQIYEISDNKILDLSIPVKTTEQIHVYRNRTDESSSICTYAPNVIVDIIQIYEDGWASIELFDEIVYIKTDCLANVEVQQKEEAKPTEPTIPETLPAEILGGEVGQYDEEGYLIVNEEVRTDGNVHARSGPSTKNKILKSLTSGEKFTRIGVGPDGWSKVYIKGEIMYITSYYLSPTATPTYTDVEEEVEVTKDAYVRSGSSILGKKIGYVDKGQIVTRVAIGSNGWSKILYKGEQAYVYSLYLVPLNKPEETPTEFVEETIPTEIAQATTE